MNIFAVDNDPVIAAQSLCDKHVMKMTVESAQMLSTAHRMVDGYVEKRPSKSGKRMINYWSHPDNFMEQHLYKAVHYAHPCTVWTMQSKTNYHWHYLHYAALAKEYEYRYGKFHGSFNRDTELGKILGRFPENIPDGGQTPFALAMGAAPECVNSNDPVQSYRTFYQTKQDRFKMVWTNREMPEWFKMKETLQ